tara:strand:+ start:3471 stop:4067 length:597 start_codon:yes stop_codon:yes gene_type:complete
MPNFENLFNRLIQNPQFFVSFFVGGLLCFIPIINLFAFGYLYRIVKNIRHTGSFKMPEWDSFEQLFIDGIRMSLIFLVYGLLPFTFGFFILSLVLPGIGLLEHNIISSILKITILVVFCSAIYRYQRSQSFYALLDFKLIMKMALLYLQSQGVVLLACYGLFYFFLPLYGFSIFGALLLAFIQTTGFFYQLELKKGLY